MRLSIVILAAGQGKRMKSNLPKVLQPLAGQPMLAHVIASAKALRADAIHVVYGHGGEQVKQALASLRNGPTVLVIAHRYSMVKEFDHVIVLDAGRVVEAGSPEELVSAGGRFSQLARGNGNEIKTDDQGDETTGEEDDDDGL